MNIGFVTTWLERGATYVTKTYINLLESNNNIYVFARGGEFINKNDKNKNIKDIEYGLRLRGTCLDWKQLSKWIEKNNIECIFFNEQTELENVYRIKLKYPHIILGTYVDYYKEDTIEDFDIFDFLICNTRRHYNVFRWHPNSYYVPWGVDTELIKYNEYSNKNKELVFFHSMGMSPRKGTKELINSFIKGEFYKKNSKLIIHTQVDISHLIKKEEASNYNIEIINETVSLPGLYHLGDVYVYPTTLDGLGLTIYEALAAGLPVITTDCAPMNEIISDINGKLVKVEEFRCRKDAYYWPLSIVNENSLIEQMNFYVENIDKINIYRYNARKFAQEKLDIKTRTETINEIFESASVRKIDQNIIKQRYKNKIKRKNGLLFKNVFEQVFPNIIKHYIRNFKEEKRRIAR